MFFRDLKNTYRDFLLVLLGIILFMSLMDVFSLGAVAGSLLALIFSVRFLNTMLYKSVFHEDGSVQDLHVPLKRMIFSKYYFYIIFKKSEGVITTGFSSPASRKSLSPVSRISALAAIAARRIGRSSTSRTYISEIFSTSGMRTNSKDISAKARNLSNAILF